MAKNHAALAIVDIETTGKTQFGEGITEIAIVTVLNGEIVREYSTLLNPQFGITPFVQRLTGIKNADVSEAPKFEELAKQIFSELEGKIFVAHNVAFDLGILKNAFMKMGIFFDPPRLCTVKLSRQFLKNHGSYSLGKLCEALDIDLINRHRALGDAQATAKLMLHLIAEKGWDVLEKHVVAGSGNLDLGLQVSNEEVRKLYGVSGVLIVLNAKDEILTLQFGYELLSVWKKIVHNMRGKKDKLLQVSRFQVHVYNSKLICQQAIQFLRINKTILWNQRPLIEYDYQDEETGFYREKWGEKYCILKVEEGVITGFSSAIQKEIGPFELKNISFEAVEEYGNASRLIRSFLQRDRIVKLENVS